MLDPLTLLRQNCTPRIAVVGDVMLDRYLWGDVHRISPEAPVPVLRVTAEEHRLGGAGSVTAMLAALGAEPVLFSVTGDDSEGELVRQLLAQLKVDCSTVLVDPERVTTVKQRPLGRSHQRYPHAMMRIDREDTFPIGARLADRMLSTLAELLDQFDLILVSDYNKGVCAGQVLREVVRLAQSKQVPVIADPVLGTDYRRYAGCTCITPNRAEAATAAGMSVGSPEEAVQAARILLGCGTAAVSVTLDCEGIVWVDRQGNCQWFPTRPRQVADVTGAGDTVLSVLGFCLAAGADYRLAIPLANLAGGLQVERLGVAPLSRADLLAELQRQGVGHLAKMLPLPELLRQLQPLRCSGRRIVMTNGCFDLLHPGHVASLQAARALGDCLVVGLNSDESIRRLKGPARPVIDQQGRAEMLAALACVDYVVVFDEPSVEGLVAQVRPDVLVKGDQYAPSEVVGARIVEQYGGKVVTVPMRPGYSTSKLIAALEQPDGCRRSLSEPDEQNQAGDPAHTSTLCTRSAGPT